MSTLKEVEHLEGEGLMLRKPGSIYKGTRTTGELPYDGLMMMSSR